MHPVIRIMSFLILAIALSVGGGWGHVGVAAVMVVGGYGVAHRRGLRHLATMILRLRWLWLSLCVVYFWFTPATGSGGYGAPAPRLAIRASGDGLPRASTWRSTV